MRVESAFMSHMGLVRQNNEDALMAIPALGVFAIADGMGGAAAGEVASAKVIETVGQWAAEHLEQSRPESLDQLIDLARQVLLQANDNVRAIAAQDPSKGGLGSTATLLCLHRGAFACAHVGDSRLYLMRGKNLLQLTRDHTVAWLMVEQGGLAAAQAQAHPDRNLLTQCIGHAAPIQVETIVGRAEPGDVYLLCSDGLAGFVRHARLQEILSHAAWPLATRVELLIQSALEAGGGDNVSVILARVAEMDAAADDWAQGDVLAENGAAPA
jgi:protein phosphatase